MRFAGAAAFTEGSSPRPALDSAMTTPRPVVRLYSRRGCHLCVEARHVLHRLSKDHGFTVEEHDAKTPGLPADWELQVPVITLGDEVLTSLLVDEELLSRKLRKRLKGTPAPPPGQPTAGEAP